MLITNAKYDEKEEIKNLGANWNKEKGKWIVNKPIQFADFKDWINYPNETDFCNALSVLGAEMTSYIGKESTDFDEDDYNKFYTKFTLMKMFYHCMVNKDEGEGIYRSVEIAKKAISIMMMEKK